jgi:hypothetical protein
MPHFFKLIYLKTLDNTEQNAASFRMNVGKLLPTESNEFTGPQMNLIYTNIHTRINRSHAELLMHSLEAKIIAGQRKELHIAFKQCNTVYRKRMECIQFEAYCFQMCSCDFIQNPDFFTADTKLSRSAISTCSISSSHIVENTPYKNCLKLLVIVIRIIFYTRKIFKIQVSKMFHWNVQCT